MNIILIIIFLINQNLCNEITNSSFLLSFQRERKILEKINSINLDKNKKNLILGTIVGYTWDIILPFIKSIVNANLINTDIIIFGRKISNLLIKNLKSYGITFYTIPDKYKNIKIINSRWKIYLDFLEKNRNKYNLILSIDVRDTIIQNDIFSIYKYKKSFLCCSLEDETLEENWNKLSIIKLYNKEIHEVIKNKKIINGGTFLGTVNIFIDFIKELWKHIVLSPNSVDQIIINYLIYYKKILNDYVIFYDNYSPIMTIALTKRKNIILDSKNRIINYKGEIASIVHQYDRHRDISLIINEKLCPELIKYLNDKKNKHLIFFDFHNQFIIYYFRNSLNIRIFLIMIFILL